MGSEMCIRDRSTAVANARQSIKEGQAPHQGDGGQGRPGLLARRDHDGHAAGHLPWLADAAPDVIDVERPDPFPPCTRNSAFSNCPLTCYSLLVFAEVMMYAIAQAFRRGHHTVVVCPPPFLLATDTCAVCPCARLLFRLAEGAARCAPWPLKPCTPCAFHAHTLSLTPHSIARSRL